MVMHACKLTLALNFMIDATPKLFYCGLELGDGNLHQSRFYQCVI